MNHAYRLVWSPSQQAYVPAPETARGHRSGKASLVKTALSAAFLGLAAAAHALPSGGQVSSGTATLKQTGAILTVRQASPKLSVNWQNFNIAASETVSFVQPNASAVRPQSSSEPLRSESVLV